MTIEEIKSAIHKLDLISRPYVIFLHPDNAEVLKKALPDIEKSIVVQPTSFVEKGKALWMERKDLEPWTITADEFSKYLSHFNL